MEGEARGARPEARGARSEARGARVEARGAKTEPDRAAKSLAFLGSKEIEQVSNNIKMWNYQNYTNW